MIKLDRICREANVMLVFARSYGLTGLVRISLKVTFLACLRLFVNLVLLQVRLEFFCYNQNECWEPCFSRALLSFMFP